MLGWATVVFIIVAGLAALLAFIVARDTRSVIGNMLAYAAAIAMTAVVLVGGSMVLNHTLVVNLREIFGEVANSTAAAPFFGAALGLWWARQYRLGR